MPTCDPPPPRTIELVRVTPTHDESVLWWLESLLSSAERSAVRRLRQRTDRAARICSQGALRLLLSAHVGLPPESLRFSAGPFGKPRVELDSGLDLNFSVSRTDDFSLIGLSVGEAIGIDVERARPVEDLLDVARHCFSASDVRMLESLPPEKRDERFLRCWVGKEALVKAQGIGLNIPLEALGVSIGAGDEMRVAVRDGRFAQMRQWKLFELQPACGVVAALACRTAQPRLRWMRVRWEAASASFIRDEAAATAKRMSSAL